MGDKKLEKGFDELSHLPQPAKAKKPSGAKEEVHLDVQLGRRLANPTKNPGANRQVKLRKDSPAAGNDPNAGNSMASQGINGAGSTDTAIQNSFNNRPGVMDRLFGKSEGHEDHCEYCQRLSNWKAYRTEAQGKSLHKDDPTMGNDPNVGNSMASTGTNGAMDPRVVSSLANAFGGAKKSEPKTKEELEKAKVYTPQKKVQSFKVPGPTLPKVNTPQVAKVPDATTKIRDLGPIKKSQYAKTERPEVRAAIKQAKSENEEKKDKINQDLKQDVITAVATKGGEKHDGLPATPKRTMREEKKKSASTITNKPKG